MKTIVTGRRDYELNSDDLIFLDQLARELPNTFVPSRWRTCAPDVGRIDASRPGSPRLPPNVALRVV